MRHDFEAMVKRLFVSAELSNGATIELHGERAHYAGRVLRARAGDEFCVFNGTDGEWSATVTRSGRSGVELQVGARREAAAESPLGIHLVQGVARGDRMDLVVQKATELGVTRITPLFTEFGVVKLDERRAQKRLEHWRHIAMSACEQCGRTRPPRIDGPLDLNAWLGVEHASPQTRLILRPDAVATLGAALAPQSDLCLLVGPEGGFSDREYEDAAVAGFRAVSLGPRILRTETAAIAALAVAQFLWGDLRADGEPAAATP